MYYDYDDQKCFYKCYCKCFKCKIKCKADPCKDDKKEPCCYDNWDGCECPYCHHHHKHDRDYYKY